MDNYLYLYDITIEINEYLYGPGKRIVLWCSGCSIHCYGCTNKHLWDKNSGTKYSIDEVLTFITSEDDISGITFHGGEPSEQMVSIILLIKKLTRNKYNYILFTGKEIESFTTSIEKQFINMFDIVKCGPFKLDELNTNLVFRGSDNQRIIYFTNRIPVISENNKNIVLLKINEDCEIFLQGFPKEEHFEIVNNISLGEEHDKRNNN